MRSSANQPSAVRATATSQNAFQEKFNGVDPLASLETAASQRRPDGVVKKAMPFSLSSNVSKTIPHQSLLASVESRCLELAWIPAGSRSYIRPAT